PVIGGQGLEPSLPGFGGDVQCPIPKPREDGAVLGGGQHATSRSGGLKPTGRGRPPPAAGPSKPSSGGTAVGTAASRAPWPVNRNGYSCVACAIVLASPDA